MTEFWLVRHGQTDWNIDERWQGHSDIPLNTAGVEQARLLAEKLTGQHFDTLYSSDLQRAAQTAEVIGASLGLAYQTDPRLREINLGQWEGMLVSDVRQQFPDAWKERQRDPLNARPPGGETLPEVAARLEQAFTDIAHAYPAGKVLVVSHGLALKTMVCLAHRLPLGNAYNQPWDNATWQVIEWPIEV
jgi:2,3-bisphosphoglycerate-dependent phosphoglycerate mutase